MENNFLKSSSKNKGGKILFYTFEIAAAVVCFVSFVMAIVNAAIMEDFSFFVSGFINAVIYTLIIFGIGKIIDLLYCASQKND